MRKLGILVMVIVLVFGVSVIGYAVSQHGADEIGVNVNVTDAAYVDVEDENLTLNVSELNTLNASEYTTVKVTANNDLNVRFEENLSRKFYNEYFKGETSSNRVWRWDTYAMNTTTGKGGYGDYDNWVVSPDVQVKDAWENHPSDFEGPMYQHNDGFGRILNVSMGSNEYEVRAATDWRSHDDQGNELPWYLVESGTSIDGEITITVEAGTDDISF
ncbi:MAG TPA: hypothetical protein VKN64_08480 [Halanaerobiales bacterium]|nr:hypothetical protein [Halanaerobiales bacterium]